MPVAELGTRLCDCAEAYCADAERFLSAPLQEGGDFVAIAARREALAGMLLPMTQQLSRLIAEGAVAPVWLQERRDRAALRLRDCDQQLLELAEILLAQRREEVGRSHHVMAALTGYRAAAQSTGSSTDISG